MADVDVGESTFTQDLLVAGELIAMRLSNVTVNANVNISKVFYNNTSEDFRGEI